MLFDTNYVPQNTIWLNKEGFAVTSVVNDPNAQPDEVGQKYIKAGTLLASVSGGETSQTDQTVVMQPTTDPSKAEGILVNDTNITRGNSRAAVTTGGVLNRHWLDASVAPSYTDANLAQLKQSLPKITVYDRY